MLVSLVAGVFAAALAASGPDSAAGAADGAPATEVVQKKEKVVCRSERTTGSRMATRVCKTESQWAALKDASRRKTEDWQEEQRRQQVTQLGDLSDAPRASGLSDGRQTRVRDRPPPR